MATRPNADGPPARTNEAPTELREPFDGDALDRRVWSVTRKNDFQESKIDVVEGRLRLRAATIGTRDDTVKFEGIRTVRAFALQPPVCLSFVLDWNHQANGCYLTAGIMLCPTATDGNPEDEPDWLKFEYHGVPPGRNARSWLAERRDGGTERALHDEGWPTKQRTGREIGRQAVALRWDGQQLVVTENAGKQWEGQWRGFTSGSAYLYLQLSTHSNYPPREVFFDDVLIKPVAPR